MVGELSEQFEQMICDAPIQELLKMEERIVKEIRLHNTAVDEGYIKMED